MATTTEKMDKALPIEAQPETFNPHDPRDWLRTAPKAKIRIHQTGRPGESPNVQVGVNGTMFLIQRGVDVLVPEPVMRVLETAVQTVYQWIARDDGSLQSQAHQVQAYPFTRLF